MANAAHPRYHRIRQRVAATRTTGKHILSGIETYIINKHVTNFQYSIIAYRYSLTIYPNNADCLMNKMVLRKMKENESI